MQYAKLCQALEVVATDTMHSRLYIDFVFVRNLTKTEYDLMTAIWHRTSRFKSNGSAHMTYSDLVSGTPPKGLEGYMIPEIFMGKSAFYRAVAFLKKLNLIQVPNRNSYTITCYPHHYLQESETLINALNADKARGWAILETMEKTVESYAAVADMLLEKSQGGAEYTPSKRRILGNT